MKRYLPRPATVIAVVALIVAMGGSAVAGGLLTKHKVNKIITRRAPGLSVANAQNAVDAVNATTADNAAGAANADALGGSPPSAYASSASEPWHEIGAPGEPVYENGWTHGGLTTDSTAAFYKDPLGLVHLKGVLHSNAGTQAAFTLPAAYRPSQGLFMPAAGGTLTVERDGSVKPFCSPAPCTIGIDGLTFRP